MYKIYTLPPTKETEMVLLIQYNNHKIRLKKIKMLEQLHNIVASAYLAFFL